MHSVDRTMLKLKRTRSIIVMIATLAIYTIASAVIIGVIVVRSTDPAQTTPDNIIWGGSHFQTEFYKFAERVVEAADGTPETAKEVRLRYDILLNRMTVLHKGQFRVLLADKPDLSAMLQVIEGRILALEPSLLRADDPTAFFEIRQALKELEQPVSRLAADIGQLGGDRFRNLRLGVVAQMYALGGLFLGQILTFVLLSFVVSRQMRALDRAQVSLVDANASLSRSEVKAHEARQQLFDAIESLDDPFALYGADDRLILCNERYRRFPGLDENSVIPGTTFAAIMRASIAAGCIPEAIGNEEAWIADQLALRMTPSGETELQAGGQWFRRSARRTSDGGLVTILSDISDLKEREQRLREQQSILQSVLDHIPVAVTMTDLDSRFVLINREAEKRYQVTAETAIGNPAAAVLPANLRTPTSEEDQEEVLVSGRPIVDREYTVRGPQGEERWLITRVPIFDDTGKIKFVLHAASVVPQLAQAYKDLATSRAQLLNAQRRAKLAYWSWEAGMGWDAVWSEEAAAVFGIAPEPLPAEDEAFHRLVHPHDLPMATKAYQAMFNESKPFEIEYRVPQRNGAMKWIRETGDVELDEYSQPLRMIGTVQDITEQKRVEQELRESEAYLLASQSRAKIAAWRWEIADGDHYYWSGEAATVLGCSTERLPKSDADYLKIVHSADREKMERVMARAFHQYEPFEIEYRIVREDKSVAWMRELSDIQMDESGKTVRMIGTVQDVTEQKQLQEQLLQAQKMEAVGQLTGGIAHDFNNLLAVILGNLELIQARPDLHPSVGKRVDTAIRTTLRGAELTHRLLAFGRRQPLAPRATDVNELVRGLQELIRRPLGPNIDIEVIEAAGLWLTEVDQSQLENAVLNLALNARDAMPQGGKLTIETANVAIGATDVGGGQDFSPGNYVTIAVSDTGSGMPAEVAARAFEPFFTTKTVGKGTGLGLSMVYGFVKQSGGHVKLYSEPGHGTTVQLLLPRLRSEEAAATVPAGAERTGRGESILLVEDETDLRELACSYLQSLGYEVIAAADGAEALAMLDRLERIDLLLTDVILPGNLDGRAIGCEARRRRPDLKILYMSGYAPRAAARSGQIDEPELLISKPFRKSELSRKLREVLDGELKTEDTTR